MLSQYFSKLILGLLFIEVALVLQIPSARQPTFSRAQALDWPGVALAFVLALALALALALDFSL